MLEAETSALYRRVADVRRKYRRYEKETKPIHVHSKHGTVGRPSSGGFTKGLTDLDFIQSSRSPPHPPRTDLGPIQSFNPLPTPPHPSSYRMGAAKGVRSEALGRITEAEARTTPVAQLSAFLRTQVNNGVYREACGCWLS